MTCIEHMNTWDVVVVSPTHPHITKINKMNSNSNNLIVIAIVIKQVVEYLCEDD